MAANKQPQTKRQQLTAAVEAAAAEAAADFEAAKAAAAAAAAAKAAADKEATDKTAADCRSERSRGPQGFPGPASVKEPSGIQDTTVQSSIESDVDIKGERRRPRCMTSTCVFAKEMQMRRTT